ncbi:MAG TPA: M23 family metallopeptidase [Polyangiaceae bacterium]|nr:M23 family metallopeptidase [Polyangiaceae bacterium]
MPPEEVASALGTGYIARVFDNGDSRGFTGDGDWAFNRYKAECNADAYVFGMSASTSGARAHSALCFGGGTNLVTGAGVTVDFSSISTQRDSTTGDWDVGFYKGECAANEAVTGVSQTTSGRLASVRCTPMTSDTVLTTCTAREYDTGDNRGLVGSGDWAPFYFKGECGVGEVVKGVSASTATGAAHKILCCKASNNTNIIAVPSGMSRYCSVTNPSGTNWGLLVGSDPCAAMSAPSPSAQIRSAGLYSTSGTNRVVERCADGRIGVWVGSGTSPITNAFNDANNNNRPSCIFNVSPASLPIFNAPFANDSTSLANRHVGHTNGFDYAMRGALLDVSQFGQTGSTMASQVDHFGRDKSSAGNTNDHDGHDWPMDSGTEIRAVADGLVIESRDRDVSTYGCTSGSIQKEIFIQHDVGTGTYRESFVSYYAHFSDRRVAKGKVVRKGDVIGLSGNTGCSTGPHLHLGITRITNTVEWYQHFLHPMEVPNGTPGSDGDDSFAGRIEPYGWAAPANIDPWSWFNRASVDAFGNHLGALSPNMWSTSSETPPNSNW